MRNQKNKEAQPVRAEIIEANDERTVAALVLFGRRVRREFRGPAHLADARAWVALWAEHFEHEWDTVRDTTALIMSIFTAGLERHGVEKKVITATLEEMKSE